MPMAFYDARRVGDLNSRISADIATIQDIFTVTLAELFRGLILIVGGIVALAYFSVELTLWMFGTLPVMIVAAVVFGRFIRKLSKQTQDEVAASNVVVQDVLTAIVSVKSYANEWLERGSTAPTLPKSNASPCAVPCGGARLRASSSCSFLGPSRW